MATAKKGPVPSVDLVTLAQNHGGFSVKESSGQHGRGGAYTAREGSESLITGTLRSTDVSQFRREHAEELAKPGAYFGGYREPAGVRQKSPQREGDATYLDVSQRFIGPDRVERAVEFARGQGQVSIYDTSSGLHYSHEDERVPEDQKYEYSAHMADAVRAQKKGRTVGHAAGRAPHVEDMVDAIFQAQNLKR